MFTSREFHDGTACPIIMCAQVYTHARNQYQHVRDRADMDQVKNCLMGILFLLQLLFTATTARDNGE